MFVTLKKQMLIMLLLVLTSAVPMAAHADLGSGILQGTVLDALCTGEGIAEADVHVEGPETVSVTTDDNGCYIFNSLTEGSYSLLVIASGYSSITVVDVRVIADVSATLDLSILPENFCGWDWEWISGESDGDVDGVELADFAVRSDFFNRLPEFADEFGRNDCPLCSQ